MISVSSAAATAIEDGGRMTAKLEVTLKNGVSFTLDEDDIMADGVTIEDATSDESSFDLGSCIINKCTASVYIPAEDIRSTYDWDGAQVIPYIGIELPNGTIEWIQKGVFWAENPTGTGGIYNLECLDSMSLLDKNFTTSLTYPATLKSIVQEIATKCSVQFTQSSFTNSTMKVAKPPTKSTTFRMVLNYIAQIAGCYARFSRLGALELKWYDIASIPTIHDGGIFDAYDTVIYRTGAALNGGSFDTNDVNVYTSGELFIEDTFTTTTITHYISNPISAEVDKNIVRVTGVKASITYAAKTNGSVDEKTETYTHGTAEYRLSFSGNPLMTTSNSKSIVESIGKKVIGMKFYKFSASVTPDPRIEAGDVAILSQDGVAYPVYVSSLSLPIGSAETLRCGGESSAENSMVQYSETDVLRSELVKAVYEQVNNYDTGVQSLTKMMMQASGIYKGEVVNSDGSTTIYLLDDKRDLSRLPNISYSKIIWKLTAQGVAVSSNGGKSWTSGWSAEGNLIMKMISTIGISFDWAKGGTLKLGGSGNGNGKQGVYNSSNKEIVHIDQNGITVKTSSGKTVITINESGIKFNNNSGKNILKITTSGLQLAAGTNLVTPSGVKNVLSFSAPVGWLSGIPVDSHTEMLIGARDGQFAGALCIQAFVPKDFVVTSAYVRVTRSVSRFTYINLKNKRYNVYGYSRNVKMYYTDNSAGGFYTTIGTDYADINYKYGMTGFGKTQAGALYGTKHLSGNNKTLVSGNLTKFLNDRRGKTVTITIAAKSPTGGVVNTLKQVGRAGATLTIIGYTK